MPGGLEVLRSATRDLHAAVERTPTMTRIMAAPISMASYIDYLQAVALAIAPLCRSVSIEPPESAKPFAPTDDSTALLHEDLRGLGATILDAAAAPPLRSEAEFWGRLYVVRGSEAGLSMLEAKLDRDPAAASLPRRFLSNTRLGRPTWPALCRTLDGLDAARVTLAAAAAVRDFNFALQEILAMEARKNGVAH